MIVEHVELNNPNYPGDDIMRYDGEDRKLEELLEGPITCTCRWRGRYVFCVPGSEEMYMIDPKTKNIDFMYYVGGGMCIPNEPDAVEITADDVRRALI